MRQGTLSAPPKERPMPYQVAGIDVHKKMLAVVVTDVEVDDEYRFERLKVGTSPAELRALADWLIEREVEEVVAPAQASDARRDRRDLRAALLGGSRR